MALVTLNRPHADNAGTTELAASLIEALETIAARSSVRVTILTGAGDRAFCVGGDLRQRKSMTKEEWLRQRQVLTACFNQLGASHGSVMVRFHRQRQRDVSLRLRRSSRRQHYIGHRNGCVRSASSFPLNPVEKATGQGDRTDTPKGGCPVCPTQGQFGQSGHLSLLSLLSGATHRRSPSRRCYRIGAPGRLGSASQLPVRMPFSGRRVCRCQ